MTEKPMLGGCCVCLDERGWAENPLVYCDGQACSVAVHQACYGIVKVPSGPWFCRKCESQERAAKVKCELCPHRDGALKRTDGAGWAHVVCALYIPEVLFGSVSTMEPIILLKVPADRFNKTCYICEEENRSSKASTGACMTCAKLGCKTSFHVTCAQMTGMLCEEASSGNQTKYCGYCKAHLTKGKKASSAYKNLSSTKVYKLAITSSSDELTSPERTQPCLPEANVMKPGDIRYTKAGKKRTKSLEESLAVGTGDSVEVVPSGENNKDIADDEATKPILSEKEQQAAPAAVEIEANEQSVAEPNKENETCSKAVTDENKPEDVVKLPEANNSNNDAQTEANLPPISESATSQSNVVESDSKTIGLTLSSLAEAATVVSQLSTEPGEEMPSSSQEAAPKKHKAATKDPAMKKKYRENKKTKTKKNEPEKKRRKTPLSGIMPHRPVPPPITSKDPATAAGTAVYPRHSVVSLARMGLDRTETYEAHEIGENNKIFKPDFSVDGVAALGRLQEEQRKDSSEFFHRYGTTPDVSALMEALQKMRDENKHTESAIQQMTRRRDQLLLIKTRLLGLQMTTSTPTQHNNVGQHQMHSQVLPSHTVPTSQIASTPHLPSPNQQS